MAINEETVKSNQMLEEEDESFNFSKDIGENSVHKFQNIYILSTHEFLMVQNTCFSKLSFHFFVTLFIHFLLFYNG